MYQVYRFTMFPKTSRSNKCTEHVYYLSPWPFPDLVCNGEQGFSPQYIKLFNIFLLYRPCDDGQNYLKMLFLFNKSRPTQKNS